MSEQSSRIHIHEVLVNNVERHRAHVAFLTMQNVVDLFVRQTHVDTSIDNPQLQSGFQAEVLRGNTFYLRAPYTITSPNKKTREVLVIEGEARNNHNGFLSDQGDVHINPDSSRNRVLEAFGCLQTGKLDLPYFTKLILEDALEGKVSIARMWVQGRVLGTQLKPK